MAYSLKLVVVQDQILPPMKKLLLLACILSTGLIARAQEEPDAGVSESISAADSADYHFGNTADKPRPYKVNRKNIVFHRVFQVNTAKDESEVYDRALAYARMLNVNYKESNSQKSIRIPITWKYSGPPNGCVEDLDLKAVLLVEVKDIKTRITLKDISYVHHDRDDGRSKGVAKSDFFSKRADCAPTSGPVELIYNCSGCSQSVSSVDQHLEARFDMFASEYQERLKKY